MTSEKHTFRVQNLQMSQCNRKLVRLDVHGSMKFMNCFFSPQSFWIVFNSSSINNVIEKCQTQIINLIQVGAVESCNYRGIKVFKYLY